MLKKFCLLILCSLFVLSSCTRLSEFPVKGSFDGVKTVLNRTGHANVLIVHGMGGFSDGDPDIMIKALVNQFGLYKSDECCIREIVGDACKRYGYLTKQEYQSFNSCNQLTIYVLNWKDASESEKMRLQWIDQRKFCPGYRLPFVNKIKKDNVNNSVADTILYLSKYRPEILYPFTQAIRWIAEDNTCDTPGENIIVGFSMGGFICINALDVMLQSDEDSKNHQIATKFIKDTSALFFLSNSYPLFEIVENHQPLKYSYHDKKKCKTWICETKTMMDVPCWDWKNSAVGRFVYEKRKYDPNFQIVSIIDPNDLISYRAVGFPVPCRDSYLNAFLNEDVRNAKIAYFGLINPLDAHKKYGTNKQVIAMILLGAKEACYK